MRAWQELRNSEAGLQRISCVEIELGRTGAGVPRLEYVPLGADDHTTHLARLAEFTSRFGRQAPAQRSVLAVARGRAPEPFTVRYPGLAPPEHDGATVVSADVGEIVVLSDGLQQGHLTVDSKRPRAAESAPRVLERVLDRTWAEERMLFCPAGKEDFRTPGTSSRHVDLLVPVSPSGAVVSERLGDLAPTCAFNAGYFLSCDDETSDPYSFMYDPVGLVIAGGEVLSPPLYQRSALIVANAMYGRSSDDAMYSLGAPRVTIRELSLRHAGIVLSPSLVVRGELCRVPVPDLREPLDATLNPASVEPDRVALYNRRHAGGSVHTPRAEGRIECVVVRREICAIKPDGGAYIPMNGFVISLPGALRDRLAAKLATNDHGIRYVVDAGEGRRPSSAVQVGLRLVHGDVRLDLTRRLHEGVEEFAARDVGAESGGIPPLYHTRDRQTSVRLARLALGLRRDARCYMALVEGCEPRTAFREWDSVGGSADEVADFLVGLGCSDVVELDGGGSAGLFFGGRPLAKGADRHDVPFRAAERVVPGAWCYWEASGG